MATRPPTVSVLMPAYNAERYIEEAVESILGQTFEDFELIVVDDGSTDRTKAILEGFATRDPRVRLVSRSNTGYVVALNEMISLARGELLARMDADDVALPDRLERQVAFMAEHPEVVVLGGRAEFIDFRGRLIALERQSGVDDRELQEFALGGGGCPIVHPSVMMRKDAVREAGGYRLEMEPAEDLDLWLRLGERGRLARLPSTVVQYRLHDRSVSERKQLQQGDRIRAITQEARARRGLPPQEMEIRPWRPTDRASRLQFNAWCGWSAFGRGNRGMAIEYGLRGIAMMPWSPAGWRLLACALIKPMPGRGGRQPVPQ